jgi:natural product precursor
MNRKIKKLTLSVETVKNLDERDLQQVAGGVETATVKCSVCTHACSSCTPCA